MSTYTPTPSQPTFAQTLQAFRHDPALPFHDILPPTLIDDFCQQEGVTFGHEPDAIYTPAVTLWAWLMQVLSPAKACVAAVARIIVLRAALALDSCAATTGAYCKARAKLPERFLQRLTLHVGQQVEDQAPDPWRWQGRRVLLVDGTTASLPDTPENQREYPQSGAQKPGCGFPLLRLVVLLTFATACLQGAALGPCKGKESGETALFRTLLDQLRAGDVVVADRYYVSYWMVALLVLRGVDVATRLHQRRKMDPKHMQRLGPKDWLLTWDKPQRPDWMDAALYAELPQTLTVRLVEVKVANPGFGTREIQVVTTLLDNTTYATEDIADLYHKRWHVELDLRAIKQTLKMDILSCKTPEMVRKEVWTHLLAYNLVRQVMAQAALTADCLPRQLSFAGAVQTVNAFRWLLTLASAQELARLRSALLLAIGTHRVGNRPGRYEPRKVKRRPKEFDRLMRPRAVERAALLAGSGD